MFTTFAEGLPYSFLILILGVAAIIAGLWQLLDRTRGRTGLTLSLLATMLVVAFAIAARELSTSLSGMSGADAASKATILAYGVAVSNSVLTCAGALGAVGALTAAIGGALAPERKAESCLRGLAMLASFGAIFVYARTLSSGMSLLAGSDEASRPMIAVAVLADAFAVLPIGLGLTAMLLVAAGMTSLSHPRAV
jgi:hypothetical protein